MHDEAKLEDTGAGLAPAGGGWFVVNARDTVWVTSPSFGSVTRFESRSAPFEHHALNLRVLEPGQPNAMYHREANEEDFLVLHGEALLIVGGEERPLRTWDFVHLPAGTEHVVVGAGDGPCVVLMSSNRVPEEEEDLFYPRNETALRHGAGVERDTPSPEEAYAGTERAVERPASWDELPWASMTP